MNGTGPVVTISFKVLDKRGTSAIILETIQANDATTLIDMPVKASAGSYEVDPIVRTGKRPY
ncbi:MAG: hypothetical protein KJ624_04300 [Chloroflexi bacterium]|nr:hypothetical protein [Chloroflexota bacterium]